MHLIGLMWWHNSTAITTYMYKDILETVGYEFYHWLALGRRGTLQRSCRKRSWWVRSFWVVPWVRTGATCQAVLQQKLIMILCLKPKHVAMGWQAEAPFKPSGYLVKFLIWEITIIHGRIPLPLQLAREMRIVITFYSNCCPRLVFVGGGGGGGDVLCSSMWLETFQETIWSVKHAITGWKAENSS